MNRFVLICMLLLCISAAALAQETVEVTGVVTDVKREPLIGVSISVLDAPGLGTTTDVNGRYKIKMERYKKLKFSYIGFDSQEILVKDAFVINVTLKESESSVLNEVVITGTGVQKKASLTAAVTTVNVADLKSNPTSSISNALAGNVPGVMAMMRSGQPGKNISEFWIRGISTFGGDQVL